MEFWKVVLNYFDGDDLQSLQIDVYANRSVAIARKKSLESANPSVDFSVKKVSHGKGL
jgi:hypothetical protein